MNFGCGPVWGGTASLKFRQFKSAVCDAFEVVFCFGGPVGGVACLLGVGPLELLALAFGVV